MRDVPSPLPPVALPWARLAHPAQLPVQLAREMVPQDLHVEVCPFRTLHDCTSLSALATFNACLLQSTVYNAAALYNLQLTTSSKQQS